MSKKEMKTDGSEKSQTPKARGDGCREVRRKGTWQRKPVVRKGENKVGAK